MGLFRKFGSLLAYPYTRAMRDVRAATRGVNDAVSQARHMRERQKDAVQAEQALLTGKSPAEKFEQLYARNHWTAAELRTQLVAVRRSRIALLGLAALGFVALIAMMFFVPWIIVAVLGPLAVVLLAGCTALAARFAWWEFQLETRSLVTMKAFLSRSDLFRRVLA